MPVDTCLSTHVQILSSKFNTAELTTPNEGLAPIQCDCTFFAARFLCKLSDSSHPTRRGKFKPLAMSDQFLEHNVRGIKHQTLDNAPRKESPRPFQTPLLGAIYKIIRKRVVTLDLISTIGHEFYYFRSIRDTRD